jgi:hypothetical protein
MKRETAKDLLKTGIGIVVVPVFFMFLGAVILLDLACAFLTGKGLRG